MDNPAPNSDYRPLTLAVIDGFLVDLKANQAKLTGVSKIVYNPNGSNFINLNGTSYLNAAGMKEFDAAMKLEIKNPDFSIDSLRAE